MSREALFKNGTCRLIVQRLHAPQALGRDAERRVVDDDAEHQVAVSIERLPGAAAAAKYNGAPSTILSVDHAPTTPIHINATNDAAVLIARLFFHPLPKRAGLTPAKLRPDEHLSNGE